MNGFSKLYDKHHKVTRILRELIELASPLTKLFIQTLLIEEVENHKLISNLLNLPNVHTLMLHLF